MLKIRCIDNENTVLHKSLLIVSHCRYVGSLHFLSLHYESVCHISNSHLMFFPFYLIFVFVCSCSISGSVDKFWIVFLWRNLWKSVVISLLYLIIHSFIISQKSKICRKMPFCVLYDIKSFIYLWEKNNFNCLPCYFKCILLSFSKRVWIRMLPPTTSHICPRNNCRGFNCFLWYVFTEKEKFHLLRKCISMALYKSLTFWVEFLDRVLVNENEHWMVVLLF